MKQKPSVSIRLVAGRPRVHQVAKECASLRLEALRKQSDRCKQQDLSSRKRDVA